MVVGFIFPFFFSCFVLHSSDPVHSFGSCVARTPPRLTKLRGSVPHIPPLPPAPSPSDGTMCAPPSNACPALTSCFCFSSRHCFWGLRVALCAQSPPKTLSRFPLNPPTMPNYNFSLFNFLVFISKVQAGPTSLGDESIAGSERTSKGTFPPPFALFFFLSSSSYPSLTFCPFSLWFPFIWPSFFPPLHGIFLFFPAVFCTLGPVSQPPFVLQASRNVQQVALLFPLTFLIVAMSNLSHSCLFWRIERDKDLGEFFWTSHGKTKKGHPPLPFVPPPLCYPSPHWP